MPTTKVVVNQSFMGLTDALPTTNLHTSDGGLFRISVYIESPSMIAHDSVEASVLFSDDYQENGIGAGISPRDVSGSPGNATGSGFFQVKQNTQITLSTAVSNNSPGGTTPYQGSSYDVHVVIEEM